MGVQKLNFGEAWKEWVDKEGIKNISWHYGMNMQGVGTLRLQPYGPPPMFSAKTKPTPYSISLTGSTVQLNLTQDKAVSVSLYSMQGKKIASLINDNFQPGRPYHLFT